MESRVSQGSGPSQCPAATALVYISLYLRSVYKLSVITVWNWTDLQKWIGYFDVKSAPVQRDSSFSAFGTPIPFDLAMVNERKAVNFTSGIFKVPRQGITMALSVSHF